MALSNATAELQSIKGQFDSLARRKEQLEAFIADARALIGAPAQLRLTAIVAPAVPNGNDTNAPLWKQIKFAINGKANAFSVSDAIDALKRIGKPVASPNRIQIVRNAIIKRPDTFRKLSPGMYTVVQSEVEENQKAT